MPSPSERIATYGEFWPYYLSEHRSATSRWLHFVGTMGFVGTFISCMVDRPAAMGAALAVSAVALWAGFRLESRRSAAPLLLIAIAAHALAHPWVLCGVLWAYGFAWVGHFRVEGNRPATFQYPLWSLASDLKMVGTMWTGRLWTGDSLPETRRVAP